MGGHRREINKAINSKKKKLSLQKPSLPDNIGKMTSWRNIIGVRHKIKIIDEIRKIQSDNSKKLFVLQKLKLEHNGKIEYRLGYYIIGVKPRMAGKWTWGQFATIIPATDFKAIIKKANKRGWF